MKGGGRSNVAMWHRCSPVMLVRQLMGQDKAGRMAPLQARPGGWPYHPLHRL